MRSFHFFILGPSGSGKSQLIARIIKERREIINKPLKKVLYIYSHFQPMFAELQSLDSDVIFSNRLEDLEEIESESLVIIDDWMDELTPRSEALKLITRYFVKSCHHLRKFIPQTHARVQWPSGPVRQCSQWVQ